SLNDSPPSYIYTLSLHDALPIYFNQKLADVFYDSPDKTSERAVKVFNHLLNAHQVWNNRIEPKQAAFGIWEIHPVQDLKDIDQRSEEHTSELQSRENLVCRLLLE